MNRFQIRLSAFIRRFLLVIAALLFHASAQTGQPVTSVVDAFNPEGTRGFSYSGGKIGSVWSNWFGAAFQSLSWDAAADADGNAGSGAMKIVSNFPGTGSNQFTVINGFNGISPSISARQFTALECDVKFDPGSATYLRNGAATFGRVEFGMATPSFGQLYFGGAYVPATETGWVHITVPLDPATNVNLLKINNVMVHIWGGTSLVGASTLWVDNLKFTGTTVSGTATVNHADTRQRIDGFGASSAWNSTWSTAEADLFFSTGPNGVGLSLLRSRITPEGTTWETNIMQMAQARGARVWSAPWTPPASYKDSKSVNGGNLIGNATNYQNYANQLANYVASMKTSYGVNLEALSVQNEPNASTTYESCVWTAQQIHDFVPYLANALAARGVSDTKIMLPESMHWEFSLAVPTMSDAATAQHVGILGGHNYGSSAAPVTQFGTPCPLPLWETEHYIETQNPAANGLELASEIHDFMAVAEANAYHYWWLKGSGTGSLAGNSTATPAKRLYVMGNYSKFVRPGFNRVGVSNDTTALVSAYKDPATDNFVIVAANPTEWPVTQTFDLTSCPEVASLNQWVTSGALSLASQPAVAVSAGAFTYELPAYSVVTFASSLGPMPLITLKSSDAINTSSFNVMGNWNDTVPPNGFKDYSAAQYILRTPTASGNHIFGGHSLTLPPLSILRFKGSNNATITIDKLVLDGGSIDNGSGGTTFTLAGNIAVNGNSVVSPTTDANRAIQVASNLTGSGSLTNGNGSPGTVTYSGNNEGFTGAMIVNGGTILKVGSQTHLGGNPAYFEPGHLTLDNGIFQPTAVFEMNRPHGGITLGAGGGTFSINTGLTLTVTNPVSGSGNLTKTGAGVLLLNGTDSHSGTTSVSAGTLTVSGLSGTGTVTAASGATFGGSGMIAGNTTINGTLAPSSTHLTFTGTLAFGSAGKVQWKSGGNSLDAADNITAAAVSVTSGAKIDVLLNSPGSTANFLHSFWRSSRSFPVITASAMTGSFTLGTVTADAGGRPVATYGSFTLQNSSAGVNLVWTPIPGFPSIDDPAITLTSPSANIVSIPANSLSLRVGASITGGAGTMIAWSQVSGPGVATFANPAAADTQVSFSADGTYVLRCTVTNQVGTTSQDITVLVAPAASLALREGLGSYSHAGTFIRADIPTMNSGIRDQIIVGRNGAAFRGLLSFDVSQIPVGATINSVKLDLWSVAAGSGTLLNTLELHKLLTTFIEGTGDGTSAANGAGTGTDWPTRTGNAADPWTTAGGGSGTDYETAALATLAGFNPSTAPVGTQYTFGSTSALISAVSSVAGTAAPLGLVVNMANDTTGGSVFARFGSDDHANIAQRPLLTIGYSVNQTPALATGTAPAAQTGVAATLGGSTTNATSSLWSLVSGPAPASFGNAAQAATTVTFSQPGAYLLRLAASNQFGETSATLAVNVQDLTPPVISVPLDVTVDAANSSGTVVTFTTSATDSVSGSCPTVNTPASGSTFPLGTTTVTATASDAAGNPASKTFTVTVSDTTVPVITVPSDMTVEASDSSGAVVTFSTSAVDAVSGARPTTNTPASGSTFPLGTTTVTATASDAAGNPANKTFTVTVRDATAPVITVPSNMTVEAIDSSGAVVTFSTSAVDAVSASITTTNTPASGSIFPLGTTTVTTTASDAAGNSASQTFTVTVSDTIAPVITVPSNMTVEATNAAGAVVIFSTSATDAVSGPLTPTNTPASGSIFPLGTTTVTTTASDAAGNSASQTFTVTVSDSTAPAITVPSNMTVEATSAEGAVVTFSTSAMDAVNGSITTTNTPASGSIFPLGTTTVTTTASDAAGNSASQTFTVTVSDTIAPVITVPSNMTVEATNAAGAVVIFSTSATDAVSGPLTPTNTPASGSIFPLGTTTITTTASDAAGNSASQTFTVTVSDTIAPVITVPSNMTVEATSAVGAVVTFSTSAMDAVNGSITTTNTPASGSTFPLGTTTVTVTASDAAGNNASVTFTITVTPAVVSYDSWAAENFTEAELADSSISGPDATPAGDGLTNLLKYALGLPPHSPSVSGVLLEQTGSTWSFTYRRPASRPDILYAVEVCADPTNGSWTTSGVTHHRIVIGEPETWQGSYDSEAPENRRFFRLRVSKSPIPD